MLCDDISDFIVHFTKPTPQATDYQNHLSICARRTLFAVNPFGIARNRSLESASQLAVCFSEVPLHYLGRIAKRRSYYGIGFRKEFAKKKGAHPVWYVEKDSEQNNAIEELMYHACKQPNSCQEPIWKLTPFIDVPGDYPTGSYRFEWEREWRSIGDFMFCESDVAFLVIPEEYHLKARQFFNRARCNNTGPFYGCPYIDISWNAEECKKAIQNGEHLTSL